MNTQKSPAIFTSKRVAYFRFCRVCVHKFSETACHAFPEGIPTEILSGEKNHDAPLSNQENNLVFEQISQQEKQLS